MAGERSGTYCTTDDLLIGDLPLPSYISAVKFVDDAADEIDSVIGFRYKTPVDTVEDSPVVQPVINLLKRLNAHIATARLIMAVAISTEDNEPNAYAMKLLSDAQAALAQIVNGIFVLDGADPANDSDKANNTAPLIANLDAESNVEAFYNRVANPYYVFCPGPTAAPQTYGNGIVL